LIERLWKFKTKEVSMQSLYETFHQFKGVIDEYLDKVQSTFKEQVKTLLNPKFQLFGKSAGLIA
jgi:hypothetical protein